MDLLTNDNSIDILPLLLPYQKFLLYPRNPKIKNPYHCISLSLKLSLLNSLMRYPPSWKEFFTFEKMENLIHLRMNISCQDIFQTTIRGIIAARISNTTGIKLRNKKICRTSCFTDFQWVKYPELQLHLEELDGQYNTGSNKDDYIFIVLSNLLLWVHCMLSKMNDMSRHIKISSSIQLLHSLYISLKILKFL